MKIYVASSWRNEYSEEVVQTLRAHGHEVYNYREGAGFHWGDVDPNWKSNTIEEYIQNLNHPRSEEGYRRDWDSMKWCDAIVLVCPSGRSAHLELGWAAGAQKHALIYIPTAQEPELMYKMADLVTGDFSQVLMYLRNLE